MGIHCDSMKQPPLEIFHPEIIPSIENLKDCTHPYPDPIRLGWGSSRGGGGISREVLFAHHSFHQRSKIINDVARIMRTGRV